MGRARRRPLERREHQHPHGEDEPAGEEGAEDARDHDDEDGHAAGQRHEPRPTDPHARSHDGDAGDDEADPDEGRGDTEPRVEDVGTR